MLDRKGQSPLAAGKRLRINHVGVKFQKVTFRKALCLQVLPIKPRQTYFEDYEDGFDSSIIANPEGIDADFTPSGYYKLTKKGRKAKINGFANDCRAHCITK